MKYSRIFKVFMGLVVASCKTYTIQPELFKQQMLAAPITTISMGVAGNPIAFIATDKGISTREVNNLVVQDKDGKTINLPVIAGTELRLTKQDGKHILMYLSGLQVNDTSLTGLKSVFMNIRTKPVLWREIIKVQLQNAKRGVTSQTR